MKTIEPTSSKYFPDNVNTLKYIRPNVVTCYEMYIPNSLILGNIKPERWYGFRDFVVLEKCVQMYSSHTVNPTPTILLHMLP